MDQAAPTLSGASPTRSRKSNWILRPACEAFGARIGHRFTIWIRPDAAADHLLEHQRHEAKQVVLVGVEVRRYWQTTGYGTAGTLVGSGAKGEAPARQRLRERAVWIERVGIDAEHPTISIAPGRIEDDQRVLLDLLPGNDRRPECRHRCRTQSSR